MLDCIIDLSHWQRVTNWSSIKAAGILGVVLKATQGSRYVDPTFTHRVAAASRAGLLVGAYHFMDASPVCEQTSFFLSVAGKLPILALDIEQNSGSGGSPTVALAAEMLTLIATFRDRLPMVYIGRFGPDGRGTGLPNTTLSRAPLWLPEYGETAHLPAGFRTYQMWQHTNEGTVPGIEGYCNRSRWYGTQDELKAWWGVAAEAL
jgi:lysozyme